MMPPVLLAAWLAAAATAPGTVSSPGPAGKAPRAQASGDAGPGSSEAGLAIPETPPPQRPVSISAPRFKVLGREGRAVYSGGVRAKRGGTELACQTLTAYYDEQGEVRRLDCVGKVVATDGDKWARGEKATFDNVGAILEITGDPEARQGPNRMRGSLVRFYVGTDVLEVLDATTELESPKRRPKAPPGKAAAP